MISTRLIDSDLVYKSGWRIGYSQPDQKRHTFTPPLLYSHVDIILFRPTRHFLIRHLQKPPRPHISPPTLLLAYFLQRLGFLSVGTTWFDNLNKRSTKLCRVNGWSDKFVSIDSYTEVFGAGRVVVKVVPLGEDDLRDAGAGREE
jgi:hypothetical protein